MANINDYLLWRGDLGLQVSPWTDIDSLLMANLVYNPISNPQAATATGITLKKLAPTLDLMSRTGNLYFEQWRALLYEMAPTRRFGSMVIHDYTDLLDEERDLQFCAFAADLEDGTTFVAFRGTDSTIVGWKEDFDMGFESPVAAQLEAVRYLERIADSCDGNLRVSGHSKGGNLAAYAGAFCRKDVQQRLLQVCSFDGPGLADEALDTDGYRNIQPRLLSVIPQTSVVGLLLGYHTDYIVVPSTNHGIYQHDSFSWLLHGPAFIQMDDVDDTSAILSEGLHNWLKDCTREERQTFVNAMFMVVESTDARTTEEISERKGQAVTAMLTAMARMDPQTRKAALAVTRKLIGETSAATFESLQRRSAEFFENVQDMISQLPPLPQLPTISILGKKAAEKPEPNPTT